MRTVAIGAIFVLLSACSYMGGGRPESKKAFAPPAGAFQVSRITETSKDPEKKDGAAVPATEAAASVSESKSEEELAPAREADRDAGAHLLSKDKTHLFPEGSGIPPELLAPGSAREIDVRAERLQRLLTSREADPLPGKVYVRADVQGRVDVVFEIPYEKDLSVSELARIARQVEESARRAIPEADRPDKYLVIEVNAGRKRLATWEEGGWRFAELPDRLLVPDKKEETKK